MHYLNNMAIIILKQIYKDFGYPCLFILKFIQRKRLVVKCANCAPSYSGNITHTTFINLENRGAKLRAEFYSNI